jgi:Tol biopolymer transport system component/DNA-binding winged helix-turn-helix (wHTH) protein
MKLASEREMTETTQDRVRFGPFEADLHTHELWKYGTKIRLVGQPFEVLAILLRKPGELVTREELRGRLWAGDTYVDFDHGLNAAVNKLRDALSDSADNPRYVETLPRRGYRFISRVTSPNGGEAPAAPVGVTVREPITLLSSGSGSVAPASAKEESILLPPPVRRSWLRPAITTGLVLVLIVVAGYLLRRTYSRVYVREAFEPVQRIRPLTTLADPTSQPAFSPDGNYVAFRRDGARPDTFGIFVKEVGGDQLEPVTRNADDCCPAWSPDGRSIAFARRMDRDFEYEIFIVPVSREPGNALKAGMPHRVETAGVTPRYGELAWTPDAKGIVLSTQAGGLSVVSLADSSIHRLTTPPPTAEDWEPSFSPDGQNVLFVRTQKLGFLQEIMSISAQGGEVTRITSEHSRVLGSPQWSTDGKSVIFGSDRGSHPALWRVSATTNELPVEINDSGWYPAVSRRGFRLAYQRVTHSLSVWTLDLPAMNEEQHILVPATSETDQGPGPQISPDGKKLAYMSDRSGTMEIWVSDRDGRNATQVTAIGFAGTPRWSPDSKSIVFDAATRNGPTIFTVRIDGGAPRQVVSDEGENVCPSWSHDGKWIYFASHRTPGGYQVWKVPAEGGAPIQVTRNGGHAALESPDGRYVYYAKTQYANPEIWQVPVGGGAERLVSPLIRPSSWAAWAVVDKGIIFTGSLGSGAPTVNLFDFASRRVANLATIKTVPFWLGASRDGKTVVFDQPGWQQAQIMLVDNFR